MFALLFMFTLTCATAADALIGASPDGRFGFLKGKDSVQLVGLPSHEVVIPDLFNGEAIGEPAVVWSKDSSRVAFCTTCRCPFNHCEVFQRGNGSFSKLTLPELRPPDAKWQHQKPEQWKDGMLVLVTKGYAGGEGYNNEYNIAFDERGRGNIASVEKTGAKFNAKLKAGTELGWVIKNSTSADGDLAVLFTARAKGAPPADFPDLVSQVSPIETDAMNGLDDAPGVTNQMVTENVVVSLKEKRVLGRLELDQWDLYFPGRNHHDLQVVWGPAEKGRRFGILDFRLRFTSGAVLVVEMEPSFTQTDICERVENSLDSVIKKQSHNSELSGEASFYFRLGPERKIRVRALATTNPKGFETQKTYCALFQGTFDLQSKQWIASDTRPITSKQYDAFSSAYQDISDLTKHMTVGSKMAPKNLTWSIGFPSEKEKAADLDRIMNDVYNAARWLLPADRFAEVKQEQIAWLKTRDAAHSIPEKSKLIEDRTKTLQDLLW